MGNSTNSKQQQDQKAALQKRARKKLVGNIIAARLYHECTGSPLHKSYGRSRYCIAYLTPDPDTHKLSGRHCKNRWCPVCCSIKMAKLRAAYQSAIAKMEDPYFVTLTVVTCTAEKLRETIENMYKLFRQIKKRAAFEKADGIRKFECTIRPDDLYHPHFHVIVDGKENAEYLLSEWLKLNPTAKTAGQDIQKADPDKVFELFKYFTKLPVKNADGSISFDAKRLDYVMCAMRGVRTIQPFGKIHPVSEDFSEDELINGISKDQGYAYRLKEADWIGVELGDPLTEYKASREEIRMINDVLRLGRGAPQTPAFCPESNHEKPH